MNNPIIIGVGGYARAGKDTFVKIARKIVEENGYIGYREAFADVLKNELSEFIMKYYGIDVWTENNSEKSIIRPLLVAHGCQKRVQTDGKYWIDKIDEKIGRVDVTNRNVVIFVSDCRFPNEVDWINKKGGWFIHLKKYQYLMTKLPILKDNGSHGQKLEVKIENAWHRLYDNPPNDEEAKNDPICEKNAHYKLELENITEREFRINGIKIISESLIDNTYLNKEIKLCLSKCPFLNIK